MSVSRGDAAQTGLKGENGDHVAIEQTHGRIFDEPVVVAAIRVAGYVV